MKIEPESNPFFLPTPRLVEIVGGLIVIGVAGLLGFFAIRGVIAYVHGSRAAPADPLAFTIGILALVVFGFLGFRLVAGRNEERPLLPGVFLPIAALGCVAGAIWFLAMSYRFHQPLGDQLRVVEVFGFAGIAGLYLWWRRVRGA